MKNKYPFPFSFLNLRVKEEIFKALVVGAVAHGYLQQTQLQTGRDTFIKCPFQFCRPLTAALSSHNITMVLLAYTHAQFCARGV